jgi:hypothetical protein
MRGTVETMAIDVEHGEPIETRAPRAVDEAGAHAGLKMVVRQIRSIELDELLRGTKPGETVRHAVNQLENMKGV